MTESLWRGPYTDTERSAITTCKRRCQSRDGLGLLRVNKQIHREASDVFYKKNLFCFPSTDAFLSLRSNPIDAADSIRRLSILQEYSMHTYMADALTYHDRQFWSILTDFPRLTELEIPIHTAQPFYAAERVLEHTNLRKLRVTHHSIIRHEQDVKSWQYAKVVMRLERDIALPRQFLRRQCQVASLASRRCRCERFVRLALRDLETCFYSVHDSYGKAPRLAKRCYNAGWEVCEDEDPISPNGLPVKTKLKLPDGTKEQVTLIGLPRLKQKSRIAAGRWERNGRIPRQNVTHQPYIPETREDATNATMRCPGQSKRAQRSISAAQKNSDDDKALRDERRAQEAKRTAQVERKARKMACKDLQRSTREQKEEKKASLKRLGRKTLPQGA